MVDLDRLMASEPAPLAPLGLAPAIMAAIAELRRAELRQLRLQVLVPVAAAVLLALLATFGADSAQVDAWTPDPTPAYTYGQAWLDAFRVELQTGVDTAFATLPDSPPLLLLGLMLPVIVVANWLLARGRPLPSRSA